MAHSRKLKVHAHNDLWELKSYWQVSAAGGGQALFFWVWLLVGWPRSSGWIHARRSTWSAQMGLDGLLK